jgi:hypothetical protein
MSTKVATKKPARFAVGDRVQEVKNFGDHCIRPSHPDFEKITRMIHHRRQGSVVGFKTRKNTRGHAINYALVIWDQFKTPTQHCVSRLKRMEIPETASRN